SPLPASGRGRGRGFGTASKVIPSDRNIIPRSKEEAPMRIQPFAVVVCLLGIGLASAGDPTRPEPPAAPVRIGMLASMFRHAKPGMFDVQAKPFRLLVEAQTGLKSELLLVPTADELRR